MLEWDTWSAPRSSRFTPLPPGRTRWMGWIAHKITSTPEFEHGTVLPVLTISGRQNINPQISVIYTAFISDIFIPAVINKIQEKILIRHVVFVSLTFLSVSQFMLRRIIGWY
jgi:hypothetical protein